MGSDWGRGRCRAYEGQQTSLLISLGRDLHKPEVSLGALENLGRGRGS